MKPRSDSTKYTWILSVGRSLTFHAFILADGFWSHASLTLPTT